MSFFGLEQPIVSHLAATCVSIGFIAGIGDAQSIGWNANFVQEKSVGAGKYGAAFVFAHPDFLSLQSETAQGACQFNKQRWVIAVCSRDQRGVETAHKGLANNVRQSNGPLVIEVLDAMRTLRWTAINDKREGMRELRRVDIGGTLPGIVVNNNGLYITLLCFEADLTSASSPLPGVSYPVPSLPQIEGLITAAIDAHEAAPDPHPQYVTEAELQELLGGPTGPELTYDGGGALTRIDYNDGSYKVFTYDAGNGGRLDRVDFTVGAVNTRKQLVYNLNGTLHEIVQTTL